MASYKVIGHHEVLEHKPGEEFDADIDPVQEARLVWGGHIERVVAGSVGAGEDDASTTKKAWSAQKQTDDDDPDNDDADLDDAA